VFIVEQRLFIDDESRWLGEPEQIIAQRGVGRRPARADHRRPIGAHRR